MQYSVKKQSNLENITLFRLFLYLLQTNSFFFVPKKL